MRTVNPFEQAAIPSAIAILQGFQAFLGNMGSDPTQWALKFPGALQVFNGTVELQGPALAAAEAGALQSAASTKVASWITALQAAQTAAATPATGN